MATKQLSLFMFSVLALVLVIGFAVAVVDFVNTTGDTQTVNPGDTATVSFQLKDDGLNTGNFTGMTFNTPLTLTFGLNSFDSESIVTGIVDPLLNGATSGTMSLDFIVPLSQAPGVYTGDLELTGTYINSVGPYTLPISVTVNSVKSLSVSSLTIKQGDNSGIITIKNEGNINLLGIELTSTISGDFDVEFSSTDFNLVPSNGFDLNAGDSGDVTVTITTELDRLDLGTNSITVTATANGGTSATGTVRTDGDYCKFEDNGNLEIRLDVDVREGFGDNEDWYPFDVIEVEIDIDNNGREKINDIEVEWGLYDKKRDRFIIDDEESDFNLRDGKDETLKFEFQLDEDIDDLEDGDFIFIVKATGEDKEFDGDRTCVSVSEEIDMQIDSDFVILDNVKIPESVSPGGNLQFTADVWNIGDDDQEDVLIRISILDLGVSEKIIIRDINAFEDEPLIGSIAIPADAEAGKFYTILFEVYDEDGDIYESDDDDLSRFGDSFKVEGPSIPGVMKQSDIIITADLESGGDAGEDLVVKVTITNLGSTLAGYDIDASGFSGWASLSSISPRTVILDSGDSKDVLFTFKVDDDASGENFFDVEVSSDGKLVASQSASVTIEGSKPRGGFGGITGGFLGGENTGYLWGIGIINIILVIVIIIVAIRISRR